MYKSPIRWSSVLAYAGYRLNFKDVTIFSHIFFWMEIKSKAKPEEKLVKCFITEEFKFNSIQLGTTSGEQCWFSFPPS